MRHRLVGLGCVLAMVAFPVAAQDKAGAEQAAESPSAPVTVSTIESEAERTEAWALQKMGKKSCLMPPPKNQPQNGKRADV